MVILGAIVDTVNDTERVYDVWPVFENGYAPSSSWMRVLFKLGYDRNLYVSRYLRDESIRSLNLSNKGSDEDLLIIRNSHSIINQYRSWENLK